LDRDLKNYFAEYSKLPFENTQEHYRKRKILEWIKTENLGMQNILEVGCGEDSIFNYIKHGGLKYIIEPIKEMLSSTQNIKLDKEIHVVVNTLENAHKNLDVKFDIILVSSLIHEIKNPIEFILRCKEMLNKNGEIIIVTNNKMSIHRILGVELGILQNIDSKTDTEVKMQQFTGAFTTVELIELVERCKLKVSKIETFFPKILPHEKMQEAIKSGKINSNFLDNLYLMINYLPEFGSEIIAEVVNE
jgi:2-polyprenyl-3-methyl-5-hydroxy-6-metoxy-1,4-benzoquinol methylase